MTVAVTPFRIVTGSQAPDLQDVPVLVAHGDPDDHLRLTVLLAHTLGGQAGGAQTADAVETCTRARSSWSKRREALSYLFQKAAVAPARASYRAVLVDIDALDPGPPRAETLWDDRDFCRQRAELLTMLLKEVNHGGFVLVRPRPSTAVSLKLESHPSDENDSSEIVADPSLDAMLGVISPECRPVLLWIISSTTLRMGDLTLALEREGSSGFERFVLGVAYEAIPYHARKAARRLSALRGFQPVDRMAERADASRAAGITARRWRMTKGQTPGPLQPTLGPRRTGARSALRDGEGRGIRLVAFIQRRKRIDNRVRKRKIPMHLFTWNVCGRSAMTKHAFRYLERIAEGDHVIATLQEWPWEFPDLSNHTLRSVPVGDKSKILYSSSLELRDWSLDSSGRATIARFRLPAGNELTCVGLHWYHRDSLSGISDAYERGGAMALFRHHLEEKLGVDTPAVIMGDFNTSAREHEREIASPYCLFALSARHRNVPSMETVMGRRKRSWLLVEPDVPTHLGTFYWRHTETWSILDHVVLTPELEKGLLGAEVLTEMEGHSFITMEKEVPRSKNLASDHLPVMCRIHYQ